MGAARPRIAVRRAGSAALEVERAGVDAVAQARRAGAVGEDVAEVAAAARTRHLRPHHPVGRVDLRVDAVERGRLDEARPAGARVELRLGAEQLRPTAGAAVDARLLRVDVGAGEGPLGALPAQHLVLLRAELGPPIGVRLLDALAHTTTAVTATNCVAAATTTSTWNTSWNPNTAGTGFGHCAAYASAPSV